MNKSLLTITGSVVATVAVSLLLSCSCRQSKSVKNDDSDTVQNTQPRRILAKLNSPAELSQFRIGDNIKVTMTPGEGDDTPDSVQVFYNSIKCTTLKSAPWETNIPGDFVTTVGKRSVKIMAFKEGSSLTVTSRFVTILSSREPVRYGYKVIRTFPHDKGAFTQGLFYHKGVFYEGTGQEANSSLRKVDPETGKILRQLNLGASFFGEGIALLNNKIYQVTWQSKVGFVYDLETFKQINKVYYQSEGWGLTTMNDKLVMSDGTNILYIIEPETFTVVGRIEVYDNEQGVDTLNELEYINGEIWANIWMTDLIARIDPVSGMVNGYIDLKGILKDPDTDTTIDVLNGIAWDKESNRIFVTGKNWPSLFEIKATE